MSNRQPCSEVEWMDILAEAIYEEIKLTPGMRCIEIGVKLSASPSYFQLVEPLILRDTGKTAWQLVDSAINRLIAEGRISKISIRLHSRDAVVSEKFYTQPVTIHVIELKVFQDTE